MVPFEKSESNYKESGPAIYIAFINSNRFYLALTHFLRGSIHFGCRQQKVKEVPIVRPPENIVDARSNDSDLPADESAETKVQSRG